MFLPDYTYSLKYSWQCNYSECVQQQHETHRDDTQHYNSYDILVQLNSYLQQNRYYEGVR